MFETQATVNYRMFWLEKGGNGRRHALDSIVQNVAWVASSVEHHGVKNWYSPGVHPYLIEKGLAVLSGHTDAHGHPCYRIVSNIKVQHELRFLRELLKATPKQKKEIVP